MRNHVAVWGTRTVSGEILWAPELDSFSDEEKSRFALATVDLYFKIDDSYNRDPAGEEGQALAARWLELIESRTGARLGSGLAANEHYESWIRWMDSWPPAIYKRIGAINMDKVSAFILEAMSRERVHSTKVI